MAYVTNENCEKRRDIIRKEKHDVIAVIDKRLAVIDDKIQKNHERHLIFKKDIDLIRGEMQAYKKFFGVLGIAILFAMGGFFWSQFTLYITNK